MTVLASPTLAFTLPENAPAREPAMHMLTRYTGKWTTIYLVLAALPLVTILIGGDNARRGFGMEGGVMLGVLALSLMSLQAAFSGRHRQVGPKLGVDNMLQFHRRIGTIVLFLVFAHPLWLISHNPAYLSYFDPRDETLRALSLNAMLLAIVVLVCGSLWRKKTGPRYEYWRLLHGGLSVFLVCGGLGHALMVGHHTHQPLVAGALILLVGSAVGLLVESRLLRPRRLRKQPWEITRVTPERGDATTLTLAPCGDYAMHFTPGQFAWITVGDTPFSLQQHPFSIASSATRSDEIRMVIKNLGDFSARAQHLQPGTRAFLEGPYGSFALQQNNRSGVVLIAGGIGITPILSILHTFRDQAADIPLWLIYASAKQSGISCKTELDELARALPLEITYVLSDPEEGWEGETGYVDADLIARVVPPDDGLRTYFVCGPAPMMDVVERALKAHGATTTRMFSDRFNLV